MGVKMIKFGSLMIIIALILIGCATIVSKSDWPVTIRSTPEHADVSISDVKEGKKVYEGKTPATLTLTSKGGYFRSKDYLVRISKEGYETQTITISSRMNGWYLGNLIFGGLIGFLIVDPLTGAMWSLDPREIDLTLASKTSEMPSDKRTLSVVHINDVPDHLRHKLIRIK